MNEYRSLQDTGFDIKIGKMFQYKTIQKGLILFILCTAIAFTFLFFINKSAEFSLPFIKINIIYMAIAALLMLLDLILGGLRYFLLIKKIKTDVLFTTCLKANLADVFMSAVTPFQTGGGPAMLYVFKRGGIPIPLGLSVSVISFIMTLIFILFASIVSIIFVDLGNTSVLIDHLIKYGFIILSLTLILFISVVWKPDILIRGLNKFIKIISTLISKNRSKKFEFPFTDQITRYHDTISRYLKKEPLSILLCFIVTVLIFLNKFTLTYFLVRSLGITVNYIAIVSIQVLLLFLPYFSPSPGGSGISEITIAGLMTVFLPDKLLVPFTFLQKSFLMYIPLILGLLVVIRELRKHLIIIKRSRELS